MRIIKFQIFLTMKSSLFNIFVCFWTNDTDNRKIVSKVSPYQIVYFTFNFSSNFSQSLPILIQNLSSPVIKRRMGINCLFSRIAYTSLDQKPPPRFQVISRLFGTTFAAENASQVLGNIFERKNSNTSYPKKIHFFLKCYPAVSQIFIKTNFTPQT